MNSNRIKYREEFVAPSILYSPTKNNECYSCSFVLNFFDRKGGLKQKKKKKISIVVQFWDYKIFSNTLGTNVCYKYLLPIEL